MKRATTLMNTLAFAATLAATQGSAETYTANVGWAPSHIITKNAYTNFAASLKAASDGDLTLEVYTGGSLIDVKGTLQGVADGIAQVGMVTGAYLPADLPLNNTIADMAFIADDPIAAAFAFAEVNFTQPRLQAEWAKAGVVYGGAYSTPVYNFICTARIENLADAKGLKFRTAGAAHVRWVEHIGGVPVSVPFSEVYTGLQRGSIDCAMSDPTALVSGFKVAEVAKFVTLLPMGTHTSGATWAMNPEFWAGLTGEAKTTLFSEMALATARMEVDYEGQVSKNIEGAKAMGVEFITPAEDLISTLAAFNAEYVTTLPQISMENRGVEDPTEIIAAYADAEARWKERLAGVEVLPSCCLSVVECLYAGDQAAISAV